MVEDTIVSGKYTPEPPRTDYVEVVDAELYPMFATTVTDLVVSVDSQTNTLTFAYTISGEAKSTIWTYKD